MGYLGKMVYNGKDDHVALRLWQLHHKVWGNVRPGASGHRQRLQRTGRWGMGRLLLGADKTGCHANVFLLSRPPEPLLEKINVWVTGELRSVVQLEDLGPQIVGDNVSL